MLFLVVTLLTTALKAQVGTLSGVVKDATTGESLIGATVVIKGTSLGAATDFDGNYQVKGIKAGTYVVEVSYISYATKVVDKVVIVANQTTVLKVSLDSDEKKLTTVEVVATRRTGTEMSVITELKKADQIAVGVSAAQIAKTQDRDASAVIRRVPGVSIQDGRFVVIRGLSDRYNNVLLNDVLTPSIEVDKKAFSFDLIPSAMIDRMLVFKSGGADLPAEFAGGIIKVYTKNIPDENFVSAGFQLGYRSGTTGRNTQYNSQGGTSFLGFDQGGALPAAFPDRVRPNQISAAEVNQLGNRWSTRAVSIAPDMRFNLATGYKFKIGKIDAGNLTTISYSNTWQSYQQFRNRWGIYDPEAKKSLQIFEQNDDFTQNNVNVGIISNFNFRLGSRTSIDFRNFLNQSGRNETTIRTGSNENSIEFLNYGFRYEQRTVYSGQLGLTHTFDDRNEIKSTVGYSRTDRSEPDYRRVRTIRPAGSNEPFRIVVPPTASTFDAARFFSKLSENGYVATAAFEHKMGELVDGEQFQNKWKIGFYVDQKSRESAARWMSYRATNGFNDDILNQPVDQVFADQNIGPGGFTLQEGTNPSDFYTASNTILAGFGQINYAITPILQAVVGLRAESSQIKLNSANNTDTVVVDYPQFILAPSLNLALNLTEKQILRFAYTNSVNRPEFREFAPFSYYDFNNDVNIFGNPALKAATIQNFDLRWELYPNPTELITLGVFYKTFKNPIERFIIGGSGGNVLLYSFQNADKAVNYGVEAEVRKSLEGLSNSKFLNNVTVLFNASLLKSTVSLNTADPTFAGQENNRPLQGQSPILVNTGIYYTDTEKGLQVNVLYNVVSKNLYAVGDAINPSQYELPRNVLDLNVTKRLRKNLELRAGVADIINQKYRRVQDSDRNQKIDGLDENILNFIPGRIFSAGISFKF